MDLLTFFLLILIAGIAAGAHSLIVGWSSRGFAGAFVAYAILLVFPTVLPNLIGG